DVPLRPDQRKEIEGLATAFEQRHAAGLAARKDFADVLAASIERGSIDRTAITPKIQAIGDAMAQAQPADRAAIERLHAILDHDQRVELVDAAKAQFHDRKQDHFGRHHMEEWARDLKLTSDQRDRIRDALKARFEGEARGAWKEGAKKGKHAF